MKNEHGSSEFESPGERAKLIEAINELSREIRMRLRTILTHPETPEVFKGKFDLGDQ